MQIQVLKHTYSLRQNTIDFFIGNNDIFKQCNVVNILLYEIYRIQRPLYFHSRFISDLNFSCDVALLADFLITEIYATNASFFLRLKLSRNIFRQISTKYISRIIFLQDVNRFITLKREIE